MTARMFLGGVISPMLFRLGGLAAVIFVLGCSTAAPPPAQPAVQPATRLIIINQTNYDWHLTLSSPTGPEKSAAAVPPRATVTLNLAGGDYVIEQTASGAEGAEALSRRIPVRLEPGRTYHWRLDTLLSDSAGDPARDRP